MDMNEEIQRLLQNRDNDAAYLKRFEEETAERFHGVNKRLDNYAQKMGTIDAKLNLLLEKMGISQGNRRNNSHENEVNHNLRNSTHDYDSDRRSNHEYSDNRNANYNQNFAQNMVQVGFQTQAIRLQFPTFGGKNCNEWIYKSEQYFGMYDMDDAQKVRIASFHMEETALVWFQEFVRNEPFVTWKKLVYSLKIRFRHSAYDDAFHELVRLRQTHTVTEYKAKFEELSNMVEHLSDEYRLSLFWGELKEDIRYLVKALHPLSVIEAFDKARLYEQQNFAQKRSVSRFTGSGEGNTMGYRNQNPVQYSAPMEKLVAQKEGILGETSRNNGKEKPVYKRWDQETHNERRAKGMCFTCDERWSKTHQCPNRKPRIYYIEYEEELPEKVEDEVVIAEEEVEEIYRDLRTEERAEVTHYAITGMPAPDTIRLVGTINKQQVLILIDCGSTHNFIDGRVLKRAEIEVIPSTKVEVQVANGAKMLSEGKCRNIPVRVQKEEFEVDFMVLPVAGCDVVLGVQWMQTVGTLGHVVNAEGVMADPKKIESMVNWPLVRQSYRGLH